MPRPDRAALDACLADMRAAPKDAAPIAHLCYRPDFGRRVFCDRLILDAARGVIGDRWAAHAWLRTKDGAPDPRIQVAIIPTRLLRLVWDGGDGEGSDAPPHPGDTIAADLDPSEATLPAGARLKAGTAVIEVSDVFNDSCVKWKVRYGQDAYDWARDPALRPRRPRGLFCRIVRSGVVTMADRLVRVQADG